MTRFPRPGFGIENEAFALLLAGICAVSGVGMISLGMFFAQVQG